MIIMPNEIRISLLGHKDHGKSTLIGRILHDTGSITNDRVEEARAICRGLGKEFEFAFLLDSFVEEREGGFTLDTTVAQARHGDCIYNLIDVPGHKELVKNMLSGASMADAAILIVSAQKGEGLQDETKLHIYLAKLLGISRLVIAVNKMDAAGYSEAEFRAIEDGMRALLGSFGFVGEEVGFIPISAMKGDNIMSRSDAMPWYHGKPLVGLMEVLAQADRRGAALRLPGRIIVQDVYDMDGERLAVGRVEAGTFRNGEDIEILPACSRTTVSGLRSGTGSHLGEASAGQNIGVILKGGAPFARGAIFAEAARSAKPVMNVRARVFCLPECRIGVGETLTAICGPQESGCRISSVISAMHPIRESVPRVCGGILQIGASEAAEAEIAFDSPLVLEPFSAMPPLGRFVLARGGKVVGVGVIA